MSHCGNTEECIRFDVLLEFVVCSTKARRGPSLGSGHGVCGGLCALWRPRKEASVWLQLRRPSCSLAGWRASRCLCCCSFSPHVSFHSGLCLCLIQTRRFHSLWPRTFSWSRDLTYHICQVSAVKNTHRFQGDTGYLWWPSFNLWSIESTLKCSEFICKIFSKHHPTLPNC